MPGPFGPDVDPYYGQGGGGVDAVQPADYGVEPAPTAAAFDPNAVPVEERRRAAYQRALAALLGILPTKGFGEGALATGGTVLGSALLGSPAQAGEAQAGPGAAVSDHAKNPPTKAEQYANSGPKGVAEMSPGEMPKYVAPDIESDPTIKDLRASRKLYQDRASKGNKTLDTTKAELDKYDAAIAKRIKEIEDPAKRTHEEAMGDYNRRVKDIADKKQFEKDQELAADRNRYRMYGIGAGLGTAGILSLLAGRKYAGAIKGFDKTAADISKMTSKDGNLVVAKGNTGADLHAAVNQGYRQGGAKEPFPSMSDVYSAGNKTELADAKDAFARGGEKVSTGAPFGKAEAKPLQKMPRAVEWGIPAGFAGESAASFGYGSQQDNRDSQELGKNMGWFGAMATAAHLGGRKLGAGIVGSMKPNELSMRAVNAGRNRLEKDVATTSLKGLKQYAQQTENNAIAGLPQKGGGFKPGDKATMQALRDHRAQNVVPTRASAAADMLGNPQTGDQIADAVARSRVEGKIDRNSLRKNLRQIYGPVFDFRGGKVKIDDHFVKKLVEALGDLA